MFIKKNLNQLLVSIIYNFDFIKFNIYIYIYIYIYYNEETMEIKKEF